MKQRMRILFLILSLFLGLTAIASAEGTSLPIDVQMEASKLRFSAPEEITVVVKVTNISDTTLPGPVSLFYPDRSQVESFGAPVLEPGASHTWTGTWNVTQAQLNEGRISFGLRFPQMDETGTLRNNNLTLRLGITYAPLEPELEITRTITPAVARNGQEVSVTYEVRNVGEVDVNTVVIKESSAVAKEPGRIASVPAGEKASYTFTVTMGKKNLTSNATITYLANGKSYTEKVDNGTLKYGNVKLTATLKADKKGDVIGQTVKLTLTLKNTGKDNYENITVTDPVLGTVFSGLSVDAGKTVTQEKEITLTETAEYQFTVRGANASGDAVETATGRITVIAVDPTTLPGFTVQTTASSDTIYTLPGVVRFTVRVTNTSDVEAKNVQVVSNGVTIYTFDQLSPGQTGTCMRDVEVRTAGQFRFDAVIKDDLGQEQVHQGNVIRIQHARPTSTPTQVPMNTPAVPTFEDPATITSANLPAHYDQLQLAMTIGTNVFGVLAIISAVLLVISILGRVVNTSKSAGNDQLTLSEQRDYFEETSSEADLIRTLDELTASAPHEPDQPESPAFPEEPAPEEPDLPEFHPAEDPDEDEDSVAQYSRTSRRRSDKN